MVALTNLGVATTADVAKERDSDTLGRGARPEREKTGGVSLR